MTNLLNSPKVYDQCAALARAVGAELIERLSWITLQPRVILDVGCGTGYCTDLLKGKYPDAQVIGLDLAYGRVQYAKTEREKSGIYICADAATLPLANQSVDLIFANFYLPWCADISVLLSEWQRVLRSDGFLVFTSLGPDSLKSWQAASLANFVDMHDIGDALIQANFYEPVLDRENFTLNYRNTQQLIAELIATDMLENEAITVTANSAGLFTADYEVIYGQAFAPAANTQFADAEGVVKIPLAHLRQQLLNKT